MAKEDPVDQGMKILARKHPGSFLDLIFSYSCDYSLKVIEDPVLNIPEKRGDSIYILQKGLEKLALHIDFQLIPEREFLRRVFLYNALFTEKLAIPVCSVVIYPEKGNYDTFPDEYRVKVRDDLENSFSFKAIKLWDYRDDIESGKLPGLTPLLVLLEKKPSEKTLEKEKELINSVADKKERADLFSVAITVASRRFTREYLYEFFREEIKMLKEWDIVQEWIKEGELKGKLEGKLEGELKGKLEGKLELISKFLKTRFSPESLKLQKKLNSITNIYILDEITEKLFTSESIEEAKAIIEEAIKIQRQIEDEEKV